ncbi:hypothetical protein BB559_000757 [Furculomyces boomerangus]|uniref:Uncharacterized protein n=1 Tax=Furculomyces boomerangus TaxID=61424 RepID=A0A2T9Y3Z8_9FUNG|nr:hypothetical protein BB559_006258 [Furculomyces boomerangus]PVU99394.1 hypothetical protein BB559_000757 [Furculomyces boomerangus]
MNANNKVERSLAIDESLPAIWRDSIIISNRAKILKSQTSSSEISILNSDTKRTATRNNKIEDEDIEKKRNRHVKFYKRFSLFDIGKQHDIPNDSTNGYVKENIIFKAIKMKRSSKIKKSKSFSGKESFDISNIDLKSLLNQDPITAMEEILNTGKPKSFDSESTYYINEKLSAQQKVSGLELYNYPSSIIVKDFENLTKTPQNSINYDLDSTRCYKMPLRSGSESPIENKLYEIKEKTTDNENKCEPNSIENKDVKNVKDKPFPITSYITSKEDKPELRTHRNKRSNSSSKVTLVSSEKLKMDFSHSRESSSNWFSSGKHSAMSTVNENSSLMQQFNNALLSKNITQPGDATVKNNKNKYFRNNIYESPTKQKMSLSCLLESFNIDEGFNSPVDISSLCTSLLKLNKKIGKMNAPFSFEEIGENLPTSTVDIGNGSYNQKCLRATQSFNNIPFQSIERSIKIRGAILGSEKKVKFFDSPATQSSIKSLTKNEIDSRDILLMNIKKSENTNNAIEILNSANREAFRKVEMEARKGPYSMSNILNTSHVSIDKYKRLSTVNESESLPESPETNKTQSISDFDKSMFDEHSKYTDLLKNKQREQTFEWLTESKAVEPLQTNLKKTKSVSNILRNAGKYIKKRSSVMFNKKPETNETKPNRKNSIFFGGILNRTSTLSLNKRKSSASFESTIDTEKLYQKNIQKSQNGWDSNSSVSSLNKTPKEIRKSISIFGKNKKNSISNVHGRNRLGYKSMFNLQTILPQNNTTQETKDDLLLKPSSPATKVPKSPTIPRKQNPSIPNPKKKKLGLPNSFRLFIHFKSNQKI